MKTLYTKAYDKAINDYLSKFDNEIVGYSLYSRFNCLDILTSEIYYCFKESNDNSKYVYGYLVVRSNYVGSNSLKPYSYKHYMNYNEAFDSAVQWVK